MRSAGLRTSGGERRNRLIQESIHDPYQIRRKLPEPTVCPTCNAVFRDGRWKWESKWPADANKEACQACRRIKDNYPAGIVTITDESLQKHRTDILGLVRHHEEEENEYHPMNRIMRIEENGSSIVIKTTDIHLPRRIGEALRNAYKGKVEYRYDEAGYSLRVNWTSKMMNGRE
jgi:NMD protein affecting ribosome stability and mRNA decay